jgi:hypothetical protein
MPKQVVTQSGEFLTLPVRVTNLMKHKAREALLLSFSQAFYSLVDDQDITDQERTEQLAVMEAEAQRVEKLFGYGTFGRW